MGAGSPASENQGSKVRMSVLRCSHNYRVPLFSSSGDAICQTTRKCYVGCVGGQASLFRLPFSSFSFFRRQGLTV